MKTTALVLVLVLAGGELLSTSLTATRLQTSGQTGTHDEVPCNVPNLIGSERAAAANLVRRAGLTTGAVHTRPSSKSPGTVIDQRPSPHSNVNCRSTVDVVVSAGERATPPPSPDVSGGGGSKGAQIGIAVGAAATVAAIMAARANRGVKVPDLVNTPVSSADDVLTNAHLRLGDVTYRDSTSVPKGVVLEQSPAAGSRVERNTVVAVTASQGPPMTTVPHLAGQRWHDAEATLNGTRLRMVTTNPPAGDGARLVVVSQVPEADTPVVVGAAVAVTLQAPPEAVVELVPASPVAPGSAVGPPQRPAESPQTTRPDTRRRGSAQDSQGDARPTAPGGNVPPAAAPPPAAVTSSPTVPRQGAPPPPESAPSAAPPSPQPPAPATSAENAPAQIVLVLPAALLKGWTWLWLLLFAGGVLIARRRASKPVRTAAPAIEPPRPMPAPPHVTFVPRLDAGRQAITGIERRARSFDLTFRIDPGTQEALHVVD